MVFKETASPDSQFIVWKLLLASSPAGYQEFAECRGTLNTREETGAEIGFLTSVYRKESGLSNIKNTEMISWHFYLTVRIKPLIDVYIFSSISVKGKSLFSEFLN
jgi:hypothetical protein